jgi:hypothetical protein
MQTRGTKLEGFTIPNFDGENVSEFDWVTLIGTNAHLMQWLVADPIRLTQVSRRASVWQDRSDNDNHVSQSDAARRPLYQATDSAGMPDLYFQASRADRFLSGITHPVAADFSWICVFKGAVGTVRRHLLSAGAAAGFANLYIESTESVVFRIATTSPGAAVLSSSAGALVNNQPLVALCSYDYATKTPSLRVNGVPGTLSTAGTPGNLVRAL